MLVSPPFAFHFIVADIIFAHLLFHHYFRSLFSASIHTHIMPMLVPLFFIISTHHLSTHSEFSLVSMGILHANWAWPIKNHTNTCSVDAQAILFWFDVRFIKIKLIIQKKNEFLIRTKSKQNFLLAKTMFCWILV